jgi:hypothetical protein
MATGHQSRAKKGSSTGKNKSQKDKLSDSSGLRVRRAKKDSSTRSRKDKIQKQKSLESSRPRSKPKKKGRVALESTEQKTANERTVVVQTKRLRRWMALPIRTQSFISHAMDEAMLSVESTLSASKQQSRCLAAINTSISDELKSVKAPVTQKAFMNYDRLPNLSVSL